MVMDITFDGKTMSTAVYVKMNAYDKLLLSEGVCRQLGIVSYHSSVESGKTMKKTTKENLEKLQLSLQSELIS